MKRGAPTLSNHDALVVKWGTIVDEIVSEVVDYFKQGQSYSHIAITLVPDMFLPLDALPTRVSGGKFVYIMGATTWSEIEKFTYMILYHVADAVKSTLEREDFANAPKVQWGDTGHEPAIISISYLRSMTEEERGEVADLRGITASRAI